MQQNQRALRERRPEAEILATIVTADNDIFDMADFTTQMNKLSFLQTKKKGKPKETN
jgi:hypothetical protein